MGLEGKDTGERPLEGWEIASEIAATAIRGSQLVLLDGWEPTNVHQD